MFVWGIALVAAVHSFLVLVWVMPVNPIRDVVGQERLTDYIDNDVLPFEQSWSVFAPVPRRGGENVVVRAFIGDPTTGEGKLTNWFDITTDEDARVKYLVNPSRIHSATRRLGSDMNTLMPKLSARQQLVTRRNYVESGPQVLRRRLLDLDSTEDAGQRDVTAYSKNETMLIRFATMYATARWGRDVSLVQLRVGHRSVPNYSRRNVEDFLDVPFTYYTFGFRRAIPAPSRDAQAAFDRYVEDAPRGDFTRLTPDAAAELTVDESRAPR